MDNAVKTRQEILVKLGIEKLTPMQMESVSAIKEQDAVMLLSPTGTGKTLAFLIPLIEQLDPDNSAVQAIIIAPSRELVLQIEQVARNMGSGYKINAFYGGRNFSKDRQDLNHTPAMIIATPGRLADHLRRDTFDIRHIKTLVLDEFDKSLEVGFEDEMSEICDALSYVQKTVLTSATSGVEVPRFVKFNQAHVIDYLKDGVAELTIKRIVSPEKDKLYTLYNALCHLDDKPCIVFCNFKDSIARVSEFLDDNGIEHGCFYGGMEQKDRERALIKFRNGTYRILIATDLAARGIDVPEIQYIIHYHLPLRAEEFTHRNGRTARMHSDGTAFVLHWEHEELPDFINTDKVEELTRNSLPSKTGWMTLFISGGRKDKISKGDIAGLFLKRGGLTTDEIGLIELKIDCAFIAIKKKHYGMIMQDLDNTKLKTKKVRINKI
jgi:superfamily II DNA/RNA helicase